MSTPMYLRVRRHNQTYFILCQPDDTFGYVKEQVALANGECTANQMRLILPKGNRILDSDEEKIEKRELQNEAELHVVFQISDNEWEAVDIVEASEMGGDAP